MSSIEEMIKKSTCFGLAYDSSVRECKICEVKLKCENKCRLGLGEVPTKPESIPFADKSEVSMDEEVINKAPTPTPTVGKKTVSKPKVSTVQYDEDMPDFKGFGVEQLEQLLESRGCNKADFEKYTNPSIRKMRMVMALKKTYEIKVN